MIDNHYRKRLICRVPNSLPCAKRWAHGKHPLCRVPKIKHTANTAHTEKLTLCRVPAPGTNGKNQTHGILVSLPCAALKTHGKPPARVTHVRRWRTEVDGAQLCRVPHGAHGKQATSPCAKRRAHGEQLFCRVPKIKYKIIEENSWKNDIRVSECTVKAHVVVDIIISKMVFTESSRERRTG